MIQSSTRAFKAFDNNKAQQRLDILSSELTQHQNLYKKSIEEGKSFSEVKIIYLQCKKLKIQVNILMDYFLS